MQRVGTEVRMTAVNDDGDTFFEFCGERRGVRLE
jgi:hypothetical protein